MSLSFSKYEGTGNDFILVDNRRRVLDPADHEQIRRLCDRRFGVGADGLMLLDHAEGADFAMHYYNADGRPGSLCGNGGRCITLFARRMGVAGDRVTFMASDGLHHAVILAYDESTCGGRVSLHMNPVAPFAITGNHAELNTGSPHYIRFVDNPDVIDVLAEGRGIRNSEPYRKAGINVNFVARRDDGIAIRTYERGVEDETLSCGTGAVAAALAAAAKGLVQGPACSVLTRGGTLVVRFGRPEDGYAPLFLEGPAAFVFDGTL